MSTTQEELESFYRFASQQLTRGGSDKTIDELYDQWRLENLTSDEVAENVAAIQVSIDDMNCGVKGRNAREIIEELRLELDQPANE